MKHRLFLAIPLPETFRPQVTSLQNQLSKLSIPVVWENPAKIHMTLNFLGRVDNNDLLPVNRLINKITTIVPLFNLRISFLETLYRRHEESLIYLAPTGDMEILTDMQKALAKVLHQISPQPIRFLPHFSIGKFQKIDPITTKAAIDKIDNFEFAPWEEFTVDKLILFESFVTHKGSTYHKFHEFPLHL